MARTEVIPFREFVRGEWRSKSVVEVVVEHIDRHKVVYRIAGLTLTVFLAASGLDYAFAADGQIDAKANLIYRKLLGIGKWVIIFKGGFDTIRGVADGDMISARKSFLGYLLVYVLLMGLPWSMNQIDTIFSDLG